MNEDKDGNGGGGEDCESLSSKFPRGLRGEKVMILLNTTANIDRATTALNQAGILTGTGSAIHFQTETLTSSLTSTTPTGKATLTLMNVTKAVSSLFQKAATLGTQTNGEELP